MKSYDLKEHQLTVGTRLITGFAEGTAITVARDEQAYTKQKGSTGDTTRSKTNNKGGTIAFVLQQTSDDNDFMSQLAFTDENTGKGIVGSGVTDSKGRTLVSAVESWVQKLPDGEFAADAGSREWIMDCADLEIFFGGN